METKIETVQFERHDTLLWVTLNRAAKANAMTVEMMTCAANAIIAAGDDPEVTAVLLTGAGERVFTAGVDVRELGHDGDQAAQRERRSHALAALQDAVYLTPKPVVVVLNGSAVGAGAMLALLADACVAVDTSDLSLPEIDLGIATYSGASILAATSSRALALDLVQSGRKLSANDALANGLIRQVASRDDVVSAAEALARVLGGKDAAAFAENKRWMNRAVKAAMVEARAEHASHRARAQK